MPTTTAQFHGVCSECSETIAPGQRIVRDDTDEAWRHVDCHAMPETVGCVCEKCWLVHNGECL